MKFDFEPVDGAKTGGWFDIGEGKSVLGELSVERGVALLNLHDEDFFVMRKPHSECITGQLTNRSKITLINNFPLASMGSGQRSGEQFNYAEMKPEIVLIGERHFSADGDEFTGLEVLVDDASRIFDDFDALSQVIDPRPFIDDLAGANAKMIGREIATGPHSSIAYFSGRTELSSFETALGTIRVSHRVSESHPLASRQVGIRIDTFVHVDFPKPRSIFETLSATLDVLRFIEIIGGRAQNIEELRVKCDTGTPVQSLALYWFRSPRRAEEWEDQPVHPSEVLVSPVHEPKEFEKVMSKWIEMNGERLDSRMRFSTNFHQQRNYPIDRLVGAANMFDILPLNAFPKPSALSEEVEKAQEQTRALFRSLSSSFERDSILGALGRLGKPSLRSKVLHRAQIVSQSLPEPLLDMEIVVDEAIKCRNHYVHGSAGSFSYADNPRVPVFLTQALEFIFAASDLIEAGWDARRWRSQSGVCSHPFSRVLFSWAEEASVIRDLRCKK